MRLKERLRACLTLLMLISLFSQPALAENGKFIQLKEGDAVPFPAWCFDHEATGQIFGTLKHAKELCKLKIDEALATERASSNLEIGNLKLRINSLQESHKNILTIKNKEIENLESAALKRPGDYSHWWALGGFATGVIVVVSIFSVYSGTP